jgi:hypothetical protein
VWPDWHALDASRRHPGHPFDRLPARSMPPQLIFLISTLAMHMKNLGCPRQPVRD